MAGRVIAVADIHGCSTALASLIRAIGPRPDDTVVMLGDYCDRGLDTKAVFGLLIDLGGKCNLIAVAGNHDEAMLKARRDKAAFRFWLEMGGIVYRSHQDLSRGHRMASDTHRPRAQTYRHPQRE